MLLGSGMDVLTSPVKSRQSRRPESQRVGVMDSTQKLSSSRGNQRGHRKTPQRHRFGDDEVPCKCCKSKSVVYCGLKFELSVKIQVSLELSHGQHLSRAMQERDKIEMRELLQKIVKDTDNMKALLDMQATHHGSDPVEEVMESLQTVSIGSKSAGSFSSPAGINGPYYRT